MSNSWTRSHWFWSVWGPLERWEGKWTNTFVDFIFWILIYRVRVSFSLSNFIQLSLTLSFITINIDYTSSVCRTLCLPSSFLNSFKGDILFSFDKIYICSSPFYWTEKTKCSVGDKYLMWKDFYSMTSSGLSNLDSIQWSLIILEDKKECTWIYFIYDKSVCYK